MVTAVQVRRSRRAAPMAAAVCLSMLIGGCSLNDNPHESKTVKGDDQVQLIDSMRGKGSFESAHERLTGTARVIADRIVAAVPGQAWRFTDDPNVQGVNRQGLPCEKLTGDIARRPQADTVAFDRTFTGSEFTAAVGIVREEAAKYGATNESSLFNEDAKRDFNVQGDGYEFSLGQMNNARLNITGDCFLMQSVVDSPPGQLPPEPPIVPTAPTSTR